MSKRIDSADTFGKRDIEQMTAIKTPDFDLAEAKFRMVDLHQPLQSDNFELLAWVLDHAPVQSVTVELDDTDEATILSWVNMVRD